LLENELKTHRDTFIILISWSKKPIFYDLTIQNIRKKYTDANNTTTPSATGVIGLLEGYTVMDLSAEYKFLKITILDLELIT
jgi:hypothetical protein